MKLIKNMLLVILVALAVPAFAQEKLYIETFAIQPGETKTLDILLDNEQEITSLQADFYLPAGLSFVKFDYYEGKVDRLTMSHEISEKKQENGAIRFMLLSGNQKPLKGNSGAIATIVVKADEGISAWQTIDMKRIYLTNKAAERISAADYAVEVQGPGYVTSISGVPSVNGISEGNYNVSGQKVGKNYKGMVIVDGKTVLRK